MLAVVIVPLAFAASAAAAPACCVPAAAKLLRSAGAARIYSQGGVLYGCLGARRTRLGTLRGTVPFPARRVALYALSGGYAGIDIAQMGVDTFTSTVALVDLRTGATVATAPGDDSRAQSRVVHHRAVRWRSTPTARSPGSAGAARSGSPSPPTRCTRSNAARRRLLASSATIAAGSLRLSGDTLSWRDGGRTRSATL